MKEQNHVYLASEFVKVVIYTGFDFSLVWSFSHEILDDHASIIPKSPFCRFEAFRQRAYFTDLSATFGCVQKKGQQLYYYCHRISSRTDTKAHLGIFLGSQN